MASNFESHKAELLQELKRRAERALTAVGIMAQGDVVDTITRDGIVDTGALRQSINFNVKDDEVRIGSALEYAAYVELGTGEYATTGSGAKKIPWCYRDANGNYHITHGMRARPFLKSTMTQNKKEYMQTIEETLKNG